MSPPTLHGTARERGWRTRERNVPGHDLTLSSLTFAVPESGVGAPRPRLAREIERALEIGVTSFDLRALHDPRGAGELILKAAAGARSRPVVWVRGTSGSAPSSGPPGLGRAMQRPSPTGAVPPSTLASWEDRLSVVLESDDPAGVRPEGGPQVHRVAEESFDPGHAPDGLWAGRLSLLAPGFARAFAVRGPRPGFALVAEDVLAGGALDGSWAAPPFGSGHPAAPARIADLEAQFRPVLELAFLTRSRQRTLLGAAVAFALQWPWVATAVVPLPTPDRLDDVVRAADAPPLDDAELRRLGVGGSVAAERVK